MNELIELGIDFQIGDTICINRAEYTKRSPWHTHRFFYNRLMNLADKYGLILSFLHDQYKDEYRISFRVNPEATEEQRKALEHAQRQGYCAETRSERQQRKERSDRLLIEDGKGRSESGSR